jgi:hypothetical protein
MDERLFYDEKEEVKPIKVVCPGCKKESEIPVRWKVRTKKAALPRGASEEDKKKFAHARSYMVRVEDLVACRKCRKRIELTGQSVMFTEQLEGLPQDIE